MAFLPLPQLFDRELLGARPCTRTGRDEQLWMEIERLESHLKEDLADRKVRARIRERAAELFTVLDRDPSRSRDEQVAVARLFGSLASTGTEGPILGRQSANTVCGYANAAAGLFKRVGDPVNYQRAVLMCGTVYGMCGNAEGATVHYRYAWSLAPKHWPKDADDARLYWNVATRFLRYHTDDSLFKSLEALVRDFPVLQLDYLHERIGYASRSGDHRRADQFLIAWQEALSASRLLTPYDKLRAEKTLMWYLLRANRISEAKERLNDHYVKAYAAYPDGFDFNTVIGDTEWRELEPTLPTPEFRIPIVIKGLPPYFSSRS